MPSQLEFLKKGVAELLADGAKSTNPMVEGMQAQILRLERDQRRRETGGYFDEKGKIKPQHQNPLG